MKKPQTEEDLSSKLVRANAAKIVDDTAAKIGDHMWKRLSKDGRRVECRARLCDEIMKDLTCDSVAGWWRLVAIAIDAIIAAEQE